MSKPPLYRRLFRLPLGRRRLHDLDEEMAFHISRIADELIASGWDPEAARMKALERFGDPSQVRYACRGEEEGMKMRIARTTDMIRQDISFAYRQLVRRPLVSGLSLLTLVLGVGSTAVVFSVVHSVVLESLPFPEPDRLVRVSQTSPQGRRYSISEPNFVDFRARQNSLVEMAGIGVGRAVLTGSGEAESVDALRVSATFFSLLGIQPVLGRTFLAKEDVSGGADQVVLLSEATWTKRFGRDPTVVGRTMTLDGVTRAVVGVVGSDRSWPGAEVFIPLSPEPVLERDNQIMEAIGRMAPGIAIADVQAEMSTIAAGLSDEYPASNDGWGAAVSPIRDWLVGHTLTRTGYFLLGAVGLLLLMACVTVTNLRVAQASVRMQEMGVRSALGAGRRRIALQLLIESLVLATIGGVVAVALTYQVLPVVHALGPNNIGRLGDAGVNGPVLAVALSAALLAVLASGLAPALLVARSGLFDSIRSGSARTGSPGTRLRDALVVGQFALAVTVVLGAGLMMRSFVLLQSVDLGFEPEGVVRFTVRLPNARFQRGERYPQMVRLMDELEAIPGVLAAGTTHAPPFGWMAPSNFVARSDQEPDRQQDFQPVSWRGVAGDYFEALGVPLLAGRTFLPEDNLQLQAQNPPVIIDRALADLLWPDGENPVGKLVTWFLPGGRQCEIVGVVGNSRDERVDATPRPRIYRPYGFTSWYEPAVLVRTAGDPSRFIPAIRQAALRIDPDVPAMTPSLVGEDLRAVVAWPRFSMQVLTAFSLAALVLAALGIYGVTAFTVASRRREIGLRVALGADPIGVLRLVLRKALALAVVGITIGLGLSLALSRFLTSLLYDISVTDPVTFLTVPVLLGLVAFVAAWWPAQKAVRVSPQEALVAD